MKIFGRFLLALLIIVVLAVIYMLLNSGFTPAIEDDKGNNVSNSIAELEKVEIGGMDQWILIRGYDISNPILLWLHGGPGSSQMPVARYFNGGLEKDFTVVQWDQRGSGKSNPGDFDEQTMTLEQYQSDAHELTQYLKERFHKDKIYLLGHSWGTQIGCKLAQEYPDDYYAYVAVGQVVNQLSSHQLGYSWLMKQVEKQGNAKDKKSLQELGMPPFIDHEKFVSFIKMVDAYGGGVDKNMGELACIAIRSPEYAIGDYLAWIKGANRGSGPMWKSSLSFNAIQDVSQLYVPVYIFAGSNDYNTPTELQEKYYEVLDAPLGKHLVRFEESSHAPFMVETDKFNQELLRVKEETYTQTN